MKILILGTVPNDLLNFRSDLIKDFKKKGHDVIASSSALDSNSAIHMKNWVFHMRKYFLIDMV